MVWGALFYLILSKRKIQLLKGSSNKINWKAMEGSYTMMVLIVKECLKEII